MSVPGLSWSQWKATVLEAFKKNVHRVIVSSSVHDRVICVFLITVHPWSPCKLGSWQASLIVEISRRSFCRTLDAADGDQSRAKIKDIVMRKSSQYRFYPDEEITDESSLQSPIDREPPISA